MSRHEELRGEGLDRFFYMHGRRGDTVYRRKRNGEYEKYPYIYRPPGSSSPLKDRTIIINRFANSVSNPQYKGYSAIVRKLYYYLPYFITPGSYKLQGQTVFFVREAGDYTLQFSGSGTGWQQRICRRTLVKLNFAERGEFELVLSRDGEEHCRRRFIVISSNVQEAYTAYLAEHFEEILQMPEPGQKPLKIYRRGLEAKTNVLLGVKGTFRGQIYYMHRGSRRTFLRENYDHASNIQSQNFKQKKNLAIAAWKAETDEFKKKYAQEFYRWYNRQSKLKKMLTPFMRYVGEFVREE